jgi:hypothetical protein
VKFDNIKNELGRQTLSIPMREKPQLALFHLQKKQMTQKLVVLPTLVSSLPAKPQLCLLYKNSTERLVLEHTEKLI